MNLDSLEDNFSVLDVLRRAYFIWIAFPCRGCWIFDNGHWYKFYFHVYTFSEQLRYADILFCDQRVLIGSWMNVWENVFLFKSIIRISVITVLLSSDIARYVFRFEFRQRQNRSLFFGFKFFTQLLFLNNKKIVSK